MHLQQADSHMQTKRGCLGKRLGTVRPPMQFGIPNWWNPTVAALAVQGGELEVAASDLRAVEYLTTQCRLLLCAIVTTWRSQSRVPQPTWAWNLKLPTNGLRGQRGQRGHAAVRTARIAVRIGSGHVHVRSMPGYGPPQLC